MENLLRNDVLANVAYALPPLTREERATRASVIITQHFNAKQQVFLNFVLAHYVTVGVEELDQAKLTPLLRLKLEGPGKARALWKGKRTVSALIH